MTTANESRRRDPGESPQGVLLDGLDIIIPAHNEAHRIGPTLDAYRNGFPDLHVRIIVALDDCEDATPEIVRRHARADPRVELREFPKLGKGGVIREAFESCRADLVAFVDADGATAPEQLIRLVASLRNADGAIASRRLPTSSVQGRRAVSRTAASFVFAWLVRRLFGLPYRDTQCGAKVIKRKAFERLLHQITTSDLLFDVDLLLRADQFGYRIVEVPTIWVARAGSKVNILGDMGRVASSLLRLWISERKGPPLPADTVPDQLLRERRAA